MQKKVRVRFAPSPTGPLHIGGLRTALFNYLFAQKHGGDFLLRIEDTDQNRFVPGAEQYIIESLRWFGIPHNEGEGVGGNFGPYKQSERKDLYKKYAEELLANGWAYYAFDTAEDLEQIRKEYEVAGETFIYNWSSRQRLKNSLTLSPEEVAQRLQNNQEYVIRFKMPEQSLTMTDLIRGEVTVDTKTLDDKVLFKSDGMPTYHLANIVDDHLMQISHVIRGEEWLPSMPLHILLYQAFGWEAPQFAHLPLILKPKGNGKLSKRDGDKMGFPVFPLEWKDPQTGNISQGYREDGYFPEALLNFLALLGWHPASDNEIFSKEELIELFDLERVHKAGARFDPEKIKWFNHQYLQKKSDAELATLFLPILKEKGIEISAEKAQRIVALIKERADFVADFWALSSYFFLAPSSYDAKALKKQLKEHSLPILAEIRQILQSLSDFSSQATETAVKSFTEAKNLPVGQVMPLLRLALVGEMKGVHIFDIMEVIGKEQTLQRLKNFAENAPKQNT